MFIRVVHGLIYHVEAYDEGKTEIEIRTQYELDWTEWRAQDGAPFDDIDANGIYNPFD